MVSIALKPIVNKKGIERPGQFELEVAGQTLEDIRFLTQQIALQEIQKQERLGNPASRVFVDRKASKSLLNVDKIVEVQFGSVVDRMLFAEVERELLSAIRRFTKKQTGRLQDIKGNWEWRRAKVRGVRIQQLGQVVSPQSVKALNYSEALIFAPKSRIDYMPYVNAKVKNRGYTRVSRRKSDKGRVITENIGFMGYAANRLRRKSKFRSFSVYVVFTKLGAGTQYPHGMPCIVIKPRLRSGRR